MLQSAEDIKMKYTFNAASEKYMVSEEKQPFTTLNYERTWCEPGDDDGRPGI
jgi:hypothetical protein